MFFNIDADDARAISGWIAPDNPSAIPKICVVIPGRDELTLQANVMRPDIRELGLHSTGEVGFTVDTSLIPDLAAVADVEILEADTRTPLFRRFQPHRHIEQKFFLFDCSVMPQRRILEHVTPYFSLNYLSCEKYGLETMLVLMNNHFAKSIFFSGRSNFARYSSVLENGGYLRAAILRDPFEELAERLLFFSLLAKSDASQLQATYGTGLAPLSQFARGLPFNDPKELLIAFRGANDQQLQTMMSPMVRMLACEVDELPNHRHVSIALERLATMDVVGTRTHYDAFRAILGQLLGANVLGDDDPASFQTVGVLAQTLSRNGIVANLLEQDVALYSYAQEAITSGLADRESLAQRDTQTI